MNTLWNATRSKSLAYPPLRGSTFEVDTVVIGGGVTGLSTALKLAESGRRTAVLEAFRVGEGSTGRSTGNLYGTVSVGLAHLHKKWSRETLRDLVAIRSQALDEIEHTVGKYAIDCQFARRPLYICGSKEEKREVIEEEYEVSAAAGLMVHRVTEVPALPFPVSTALKIERQAQFNPWLYAQGLAEAVVAQGAAIFENSRVIDVDAGKGLVVTENGEITAEHIVFATHTPMGINLLQAEMEPYREYGIAAPIKAGSPPNGIFWLLDKFHSVRGYRQGGKYYLIVVGEKHETGHGGLGKGYYKNLEDYAREKFDVDTIDYRWSAQQYRSADLLPYIGKSGHGNVYLATGFAADGLIWGQVAGSAIGDQILGRESPAAELFDSHRFTPRKSAGAWVKTNIKVARHLVADRMKMAEEFSALNLHAGEGKIVDLDDHKVAVYRSSDNRFIALSPVCPHMRCLVNWNAADCTWDCPCHGSRFSPEGSVIEGPAYKPLEHRDFDGDLDR